MNSIFNLNNKNVIITGASSGIGRQCAIAFSKSGANVILVARNKERLKETFDKLEKGNHLFISQDITKYEKLEDMVKNAVKEVGKIYGFVHSAGIDMTLPLSVMQSSYYEKIFAINVISGLELAKIISKKKYINKNSASFIFIASIMGVIGNAALTGYSASKGAIISAIKPLAIELAHKNIRVNSISPGQVETEMAVRFFKVISKESKEEIIKMHPLGLGKPEDVANACIFLLSDASRWITGTNLIVDGGYCAK
jgi:NAD(P)-dependent dehydrogenase (short-subunit alcohol dehydrogenase family)